VTVRKAFGALVQWPLAANSGERCKAARGSPLSHTSKLHELRGYRVCVAHGGQDCSSESEAAADCKKLWNGCPFDARSFQSEVGDKETPYSMVWLHALVVLT